MRHHTHLLSRLFYGDLARMEIWNLSTFFYAGIRDNSLIRVVSYSRGSRTSPSFFGWILNTILSLMTCCRWKLQEMLDGLNQIYVLLLENQPSFLAGPELQRQWYESSFGRL